MVRGSYPQTKSPVESQQAIEKLQETLKRAIQTDTGYAQFCADPVRCQEVKNFIKDVKDMYTEKALPPSTLKDKITVKLIQPLFDLLLLFLL